MIVIWPFGYTGSQFKILRRRSHAQHVMQSECDEIINVGEIIAFLKKKMENGRKIGDKNRDYSITLFNSAIILYYTNKSA